MADPLFLSLLLLFPFFFFISIAAQPNASATTYPTCPSYNNCGHIHISYPFWRIHDDQTQFCGYRGFGINCSEPEVPIIDFDGVSYYVDKLIYETSSIILVDYDVSPIPDRNPCPRVSHNIDLQSLPFNFTSYNLNLSFHFNCNRIPYFATEIPCLELNSPRRKSCVNVITLETKDFDWSNYSCEEHVVQTVLNSSVPDEGMLRREYRGVLSKGFELKWGRLESCSKCEESNGRCGYNNRTSESMCFCSDGRTTTDHCEAKKKGTFIMTPP